MKKKILLQDLADFLELHEGLGKREADNFVRCFFEVIEDGLFEDKFVKIKGFGTFKLVAVSERDSVNINTGERFLISGHTKISFTPDTAMKELVNRPFAHFESVDLSDDTDMSEFEEIDQQMIAEEEEADYDNDEADLQEDDEDVNQDSADEAADEPTEDATDDAAPKTAAEKPENTPANLPNEKSEEDADEDDSMEEIEASCPQPIENGNDGEDHNATADDDNAAANGVELTSVVMLDDDNDDNDSMGNQPNAGASAQKKADAAKQNDATDGDGAEEEIQVTVPKSITSHTDDDSAFQSSTDMGYTYVEVPSKRKRNWWKISMLLLCQLLIMTVCYFAGYYRVLCPCSYTYLDKVMGVNPPAKTAAADSTLVHKITHQTDSSKNEPAVNDTAKAGEKNLKPAADSLRATHEKSEAKTTDSVKKTADNKPERPAFHVVKRGDNLSVIARKYYGTDRMVPTLMKHNKIKDANNIHLGMKLKLP